MKLICYTAILNDYDDLPTLKQVDPEIQYLCFTDTPELIADPGPWTLVKVERYFEDDKITNGFLKALSHLHLGEDVISIWVDANLDSVSIVPDLFTNTRGVAVPRHMERNRVAEEAAEVVRLGLEKQSTVSRYLAFLRESGFPDNVGLSATMFLARNHANEKVRRANIAWWNVISGGVRRDQLSFDFALWHSGVSAEWLNVYWRTSNNLFSRRPHKRGRGRLLQPDRQKKPGFQAELRMPALPPSYPRDICYFPELPTMLECETHRVLNRLVGEHVVNGAVEGNYSHFHMARLSAHTPSDPRRSWKRQYLRLAIRGRVKALEIGFNAGHSAAIMLAAEPGLIVLSIDIGVHPYTRPCANYMEAAFPERFTYVEGDSKVVLEAIDLSYFDFVHIDGGHELSTVESDLSIFCQSANSGTFLMVDDAYSPAIANTIHARIKQNLIAPAQCGLPSSGENWLFCKV